MPLPRLPALLASALLLLTATAHAADRPPRVPTTPETGTPTTTFKLVVPPDLARKAPRGSSLAATMQHRRYGRCVGPRLPNARRRADGSIVVRMNPKVLRAGDRWCRGRYRISVTAQVIVDDDDETGEGGIFDTPLARSSFVVR